jgi:hypothetical protein
MSNSITISLTTKRREDAEKIAARAAELVKVKNYDLEFELFDADDGSCSGIGIAELYGEASSNVQRVIEGVVASFPDIEMRELVSANGELYKEYVSENGTLKEMEIIDEEEASIMALRNCSDEEFKELLSKSRQGDWNSQYDFIEALFWAKQFELRFSLLLPEDEQWLLPFAKKNDPRAITLLLVGMEARYSTRDEEFIDEDTGKPFIFTHAEKMEGETLFPRNDVEALRMLTDLSKEWQMTDRRELFKAVNILRRCTEKNYTIILHPLADEANDKDAISDLAETYRYGDERNGIYINRGLAKDYYEKIGEQYDPAEDATEDIPVETDYTLKGNAETLKGIRDTINDLCQRFGTPDNEFGMFVPLQPLMKLLVGSDDNTYRGNILRMEQKDANTLVLHTESNNPGPLYYALRQCFENLTVEMKS